ncbi:Histone deacetylase hda1 [Steccherinum ochraceum]|uniref:histone deacetylase n=1 Tax=Steccherinum ochraceum TaxID=92696 RepID=A0A4R0RH26_9APHY|nr:Histone deacetylase hda1 [Steccherinum ochraceum]
MTDQDIIDSEQFYEDLSLYVHQKTPLSARLSCGGVIEATLAVARGQYRKTLAIVRPPGHHAEPDEHMGFCFFNNVSVATRVVQQLTPVKKVLILDWDVHHGNGTQRAFNDDPSVLYISIHRYDGGDFYPNGPFGSMQSCGEGAGEGFSVNIPWPEKGMGDADYIHAFQQIVMPIAVEFAPDLVIVSAGFDAADGDVLGECHVTPAGYAHMTHMLSSLAGGKMVVALEGGYNLDAISNSCLAVAKILVGEAPPVLPPLVASQIAAETVWQVAMVQKVEDLSFTIPELLKAHRQDYLFRQHDMLTVPFPSTEMEAKYSSQIACTADVMENQTLIVFVHELGNIRTELDGMATCDLNLEHSYLIDFSKTLIGWIRSTKHALLDVNVHSKPSTGRNAKNVPDIMTYLWDNYIQLTEARRVVLIGHGPGCEAIMRLMESRSVGVMKAVKAVVQVVGLQTNVPATSRDAPALRDWYFNHSFVILPQNHRYFSDIRPVKRHGQVAKLEETRAIKLIQAAFPIVTTFIQRMLSPSGQ